MGKSGMDARGALRPHPLDEVVPDDRRLFRVPFACPVPRGFDVETWITRSESDSRTAARRGISYMSIEPMNRLESRQ